MNFTPLATLWIGLVPLVEGGTALPTATTTRCYGVRFPLHGAVLQRPPAMHRPARVQPQVNRGLILYTFQISAVLGFPGCPRMSSKVGDVYPWFRYTLQSLLRFSNGHRIQDSLDSVSVLLTGMACANFQVQWILLSMGCH